MWVGALAILVVGIGVGLATKSVVFGVLAGFLAWMLAIGIVYLVVKRVARSTAQRTADLVGPPSTLIHLNRADRKRKLLKLVVVNLLLFGCAVVEVVLPFSVGFTPGAVAVQIGLVAVIILVSANAAHRLF